MHNYKLAQLQVLFFLLLSVSAMAVDTCSRVAIINYQEVLVDTSSNKRGEGLRFYLEKDDLAHKYLDIYQENNRSTFLNAVIGTTGAGLLIAGILKPKRADESDFSSKEIMIIGGAVVLALNFLVAVTEGHNNEKYLDQAVEEYNKRNLPRIYFGPFKYHGKRGRNYPGSIGVTGGIIKEF